jgi:hypothetical protein
MLTSDRSPNQRKANPNPKMHDGRVSCVCRCQCGVLMLEQFSHPLQMNHRVPIHCPERIDCFSLL